MSIVNEHETFPTEQEAKDWVMKQIRDYTDNNDGLYSDEAMHGGYFIGMITHDTRFKVQDKRSDYDCGEDDCECCDFDPDNCGRSVWEHSNTYDEIGDIEFVEVKDGGE